jgi:lipopolysaccharide export system permease protein
MVGKGLDLIVMAQFFYYAALTLVPMALPLSILLSSLMSFGGLGERLELIAMKAAGISLFRIMKPYLVVIGFLSIGSFYFSNVVMPDVQLKWTVLLRSIRHKSPDVSIPVGSFYTGIDNYSIYVRSKNHDTRMLYDMMIYDFTGTAGGGSSDNIRIVTADSGMLVSTADKKGFILKLHNGEMFENMKGSAVQVSKKNIPFRRETFVYRELIMDYDNNLNMVSEESVAGKQTTKNLEQLTQTIDSLQKESDSLANAFSHKYVNTLFFGRTLDSGYVKVNLDTIPLEKAKSYEAIINRRSLMQQKESFDRAVNKMQVVRNELDYHGERKYSSVDKMMWKHDIERHRKFTLSFACIIFFFIGAPLGAIIRKGGFGLPVVISILLFIIYYIVDNTGFKMARNGSWPVWVGTWFSSAMLFPLGLFLTYKAAIDATFNMPTAKVLGKNISKFFKNLFSRKKKQEVSQEVNIDNNEL